MSSTLTTAPPAGTHLALTLAALLVTGTDRSVHAQIVFDIDPVPLCTAPLDPTPTGSSDKPMEGFPVIGPDIQDHKFIHSSTHLQGQLAQEKWAGGLVYQTTPGTAFDDYTSVVVVNNPDSISTCVVDIDYFDVTGANVQSTLGVPIPPEQLITDAPSALAAVSGGDGVGSARVTVTNGCPGIVGAVLTHTGEVLGFTDPDIILFSPPPGASSKQQLQVVQDTTELWWGPLPFTHSSAVDFFNGNIPAFWVVNPNDEPNSIRVDVVIYDRTSGMVATNLTWRSADLDPFGTLFEASGPHLAAINESNPGIWDFALDLYSPAPGVDWDFIVHVTSEDGLPILGDGLMTDFFGDDAFFSNLLPGGRMRMASTMLANTPHWTLVNPDFSYEPGGVIQTLMGVANVGSSNAGPITIEYYDSFGTMISSGSVPSLLPNHTLRIEPGTLGYPTTTVGFGSVRVRGCTPAAELVGWSVRETLDIGETQYQKAFGEAMLNINGMEPGPGFAVGGQSQIRKLKPISRVDFGLDWPGYTTIANRSVGNIGSYEFELLFDSLTFSCGVLGPFSGLPFGETSSTYEDSFNICSPDANISVAVDHDSGEIEGIGVIGDPFVQWGIDGLADQ